jgi:Druantia protein DruA/DDE_Tnp_1-associated
VVVRPIFADEVGRFNAALREHHWLGHRLTGQVLRYVAVLGGEWVAVVGFGSAVLSCRARDEFVGWSREQQYARLRHVANNQRFCVLGAEQRPNLASVVLSRVLVRLSADYLAVYGHRVLAVETFTDPARHTGACYAAANFQPLGSTLGYSRSAGAYHHHGHPKWVWLYPLHRDVRSILSATFPHPLLTGKDDHVADVNTLELGGVGGLLQALGELRDPRSKRGIRHRVASTLTMVAAATISGARSFRSVADYVADLPPEALARLGARLHPLTGRPVPPSEATIRRTVKDIDADEADTIVGTWLRAKLHAGMVSPKAWRGLALDGKTLKGSWEQVDTGAGKIRLFSALTHAEGVVVGQRKIPENTGEQAQMIPLLDQVAGARPNGQAPGDLSGVVVTADALHVHRNNVEQILERNGEYVLTVKRNQPTLHHSIKALFAEANGAFPPCPRHV